MMRAPAAPGPALLGGDAVSPDNHQARLRDLPFLQDPDAPLFQEVHHLGVVNQGAIGVDFGVVFMDGPQHHFHGVFDTHAKSRGFGENDFHERQAVFCFRFPVYGYMISNGKLNLLIRSGNTLSPLIIINDYSK